MYHLYPQRLSQSLGQQRAVAGGRFALDAHEGDDRRAGR